LQRKTHHSRKHNPAENSYLSITFISAAEITAANGIEIGMIWHVPASMIREKIMSIKSAFELLMLARVKGHAKSDKYKEDG
jgi:hypothetical protein